MTDTAKSKLFVGQIKARESRELKSSDTVWFELALSIPEPASVQKKKLTKKSADFLGQLRNLHSVGSTGQQDAERLGGSA